MLDYGLETISRVDGMATREDHCARGVDFYCQALHSKGEDSVNLEHSMINGARYCLSFFHSVFDAMKWVSIF